MAVKDRLGNVLEKDQMVHLNIPDRSIVGKIIEVIDVGKVQQVGGQKLRPGQQAVGTVTAARVRLLFEYEVVCKQPIDPVADILIRVIDDGLDKDDKPKSSSGLLH